MKVSYENQTYIICSNAGETVHITREEFQKIIGDSELLYIMDAVESFLQKDEHLFIPNEDIAAIIHASNVLNDLCSQRGTYKVSDEDIENVLELLGYRYSLATITRELYEARDKGFLMKGIRFPETHIIVYRNGNSMYSEGWYEEPISEIAAHLYENREEYAEFKYSLENAMSEAGSNKE